MGQGLESFVSPVPTQASSTRMLKEGPLTGTFHLAAFPIRHPAGHHLAVNPETEN